MLLFYLELLEIQERIYDAALAAGWADRVRRHGEGDAAVPQLRLARLPLPELLPRFREFLGELAPMATEVLAGVGRSLEAANDAVAIELLAAFLERRGLADLAGSLGCDAAALEFFPRAFLQPVAEAAVAPLASIASGGDGAPADHHGAGDGDEGSCPRCGWPPQVAALKDEAEVKGRRHLVCSLCGSWWPFPRSACPRCGEIDADKLLHHLTETLPHIRVEECETCRSYLKSVDLRKDGTAVPVVDDLASVELDLWSEERGLEKIQRNLLGL